METINPKCLNKDSFKYSILISLHYYDLNTHKERTNKLNKYINTYNFKSNNYLTFENDNNISLSVYDENGKIIHNSNNNSNKKPCIVKINNHRYRALKPIKDKHNQLKELLKHFTHKELTNYLLRKVIY